MYEESKKTINRFFGILCLFPVLNILISFVAAAAYGLTGGNAIFYTNFILPQFLLPVLTLTTFVLFSKLLMKDGIKPQKASKLSASDAVLFSMLYFGAIPVLELISALNTALFGFFGIDLPKISVYKFLPATVEESIIFIFVLAVLPAIAEESVYRLGICGTLSRYSTAGAIIVSGIAFGLMHGSFQQVLYAAAAGLLFGYIYLRTNNIFLTIFLHFINNLSSCAIMLVSYNYGEELSSSLYSAKTVFEIIAGVIALTICIKTKKLKIQSPEKSVKTGKIIKAIFTSPFFYIFTVTEIIIMVLNII